MALTVVLSLLMLSCVSSSQDIVWYIDSTSNASSDICGHDPTIPCPSLEVVFQQSQLINESALSCYLGDGGNRSSTTIYLTGSAFVPAVCLFNWRNLHVASYPPNSQAIINTDKFGTYSIFSFFNCTNITLEGLVFNITSQNRQTLLFDGCWDISIQQCSMPLSSINGYGMQVSSSGGLITISECIFYGDPTVDGNINHGIAVRVVSGTTQYDSNEIFPIMRVLVRGCEFRDFTSYGTPEDSYRSAVSSSLSFLVQLRRGANNNLILIEDSSFHNIINTIGHSVTIHFDSDSINNSVIFTNTKFEGNSVRYGGGVATYFTGSLNGSLTIFNCTFINNNADYEGGGVFIASLQEEIANQVSINSNTFVGNTALYGSGVFLFNNPAWYTRQGPPNSVALPLTPVNIDNCLFTYNRASLEEGVISALRILLGLENDVFIGNKGSAVLLRQSLSYLEGEVTFEYNRATRGGALNVQDRSRVDMQRVTSAIFRSNFATQGGGAVYGDESSTSFSSNEYNHSIAENRYGFCFITFGNEGQPVGITSENPGRILFEGNTAFGEGHTLLAYSLRGCQVANFVPSNLSRFLAVSSDDSIVYNNTDISGSTTTGPSYLFFFGASTSCYKPVGNITYLLPNCSHDLINKTFYTNPGLDCSLNAQLLELSTYYGPGAGLRPTVDKLVTPWAGIETTWTLEPGGQRQQCGVNDLEQIPGQLFLAPAPGEQFDLTVQLADQLLNYISATIYIELEYNDDLTTPPGVLIQLNGIQYSFTDRVFFTPNRALSGLSLVGLPGTEGRLRVVASSQIRGQNIVLLLSFKLAQCPLGFYPPPGATSLQEVNDLMTTVYSHTQRIPVDQPLACNCLNETGPTNITSHLNQPALSLSHTCIRGYTIHLNSLLWAGLIPHDKSAPLYPPSILCPLTPPDYEPITNELTTFIMETRTTFDPVDVVTYERGAHPGGSGPIRCFHDNVSSLISYKPNGEFSLEFCTRGYCRGNQLSSWFLSEVSYPCISERQGVLCGQCRDGYALTSYSTTCRDCREAIPAIPIVLTVVLGLGFVVAVVALNFEASPTVDSLLFFTQAVYILLAGRANYDVFSYLAFFNPDFTFSLCVTSDLSALSRLGLQYATPLYILSLLLVILMLTKVKVRWISERLGRHSFLKSLWFLILISYLNIALTTFELLHCRTIGTNTAEERLVLEHDGSVICYHDQHLPAAIFAIILVTFIILPFPIYTIILIYLPRFKPLTDVYTFMYRDHRRLWVAWSLFRRLLLVLLGVFSTDYGLRHFSLLLALLWILLVDMVTWPYRYHSDNLFSVLISWLLVVIAIVTEPTVYLYVDPKRGPSGALVLLGIICGISLIVIERVLWKYGESVDSVFMKMIKKVKKLKIEKRFAMRKTVTDESREPMVTSTLPRYRESLLEQSSDETTMSCNNERESRVHVRHWKARKMLNINNETSNTSSTTATTSLSTTSVCVDNLDSGLATTIHYNRHNDS